MEAKELMDYKNALRQIKDLEELKDRWAKTSVKRGVLIFSRIKPKLEKAVESLSFLGLKSDEVNECLKLIQQLSESEFKEKM